jgi:hypothetical protein
VTASDREDCNRNVTAATLDICLACSLARSLSLLASFTVVPVRRVRKVRRSVRIPAALSASHHRCDRAPNTPGLPGLDGECPCSSPRHTRAHPALGTRALSTRPSALGSRYSALCSVLRPPPPSRPSHLALETYIRSCAFGQHETGSNFQMFHGASDMAGSARYTATRCVSPTSTSATPRKSTQTSESRARSHEQIRDRYSSARCEKSLARRRTGRGRPRPRHLQGHEPS